MAHPQSDGDQQDPVADQQQTRHSLRWKPAILITLAGATAVAGSALLIPDQTFRIIGIYYSVAIWMGTTLVWWLCFSGLTWKVRLTGCLLLAVVCSGGWLGLVRRLEFSGDMAPRLVWRWTQDTDEKRQRWQQQQLSVNEPVLAEDFVISDQDWPRYCGTDGSRIVREPLSVRDWTQHPPELLWRHPVGEGWSSFAVVGARLFTQEQRAEQECIVCYHADTGKELWVHGDTTRYDTAMGGIGPRATPTVTPTALYALGATGLLTCLHPVTADLLWQRNIAEDAGASMPQWGFSGSPLIWKDTVIVVAGGSADKAVLALDRSSGDIIWGSGRHHPGYSSPRIEVIDGQPMLLCFHGDGLTALDPDNGRQLWTYPFTNMYKVNVAQPILTGSTLFIGTGYDGQCVGLNPLNIDAGKPTEVWKPNRNLKLKFNEAVTCDGYIYGLDDGILCCIDAATGKRQWKGGRYRFGQVLLWQDTLLIQAEKGDVALVAASPDAYQELTRFSALRNEQGPSHRCWNVPVVNRSRLYLRCDREAACYQLPSSPHR